MTKFSSGNKAVTICDRCGFRYPYNACTFDGYKKTLRVCPDCWDPDPPQNHVKVVGPDAQTLKYPRPSS